MCWPPSNSPEGYNTERVKWKELYSIKKTHKFISNLSCQRLATSCLLSQGCKYSSVPACWPGHYKMSLVPSHCLCLAQAGAPPLSGEMAKGTPKWQGTPNHCRTRNSGRVFCIASCTSQTPSLGAGVPIRKQMETPLRNAVLLSKQNTFLCKILMKSTHSPGKILVQLSLIFQIKKKEKRLGNFQVF